MHPELSSNDKIEQLLTAVRRQGNLPLSRRKLGALSRVVATEKGFQEPPPADIYRHGDAACCRKSPALFL
jgi:hypothetical protein